MKDNNKTFWQIIKEHQIEIPVIQRDYAQGRDTLRINQIRKKFVDDLINTLISDNQFLHLDFVYGRILGKDKKEIIQKNKEAIDNVLKYVSGYASNLDIKLSYKITIGNIDDTLSDTKFIPLDGQQRLTTLFLLHWYLIQKLRLNTEDLNYLKGFKYKTRKSTTDFCEFLTNNWFDLNTDPSEVLTNNTKFLSLWKHDPSVKGMLVMLDSINSKAKDLEINELWNNLTTEKIQFSFIDLDKLEQTDELYVKMNARGKHLTDFEHFKAWLQDYIESNSIKIENNHKEWKKNLDTTWYDIFWGYKKNDTFEIDETIFDFIKQVTLYRYILNIDKAKDDEKLKEFIEKIGEADSEKKYITLSEFEEYKFFSGDTLNFLFDTLNSLTKIKPAEIDKYLSEKSFHKTFADEKKLNKLFLQERSKPTLWDKTYYFSFILFLNTATNLDNLENNEEFQLWMRTTRNLIYNTYIQNPNNFIDAIKSLSEVSKNISDFSSFLNDKLNNIKFFNKDQLNEERDKLVLMTDNDWKQLIIKYENHSYFYGQIGFIFNLSDNNYTDFKKYGDLLYDLFNLESNEDIRTKFQYAFLSMFDYRVEKDTLCCFDKGLRAFNGNWRQIFKNESARNKLKELLDEILKLEDTEIEKKLDHIKDEHLKQNNTWRKCFIKYNALDYSKKGQIRTFGTNKEIILLKKYDFKSQNTYLLLYAFEKYLDDIKNKNFTIKPKYINNYETLDNYSKILIENGNLEIIVRYLEEKSTLVLDNQNDLIEGCLQEFLSICNNKR